MTSVMAMQGRRITGEDLDWVRGLLESNPGWNCTRLSRELVVGQGSADARIFNSLLAHEHYPGCPSTT
jgi:hypothetical protein